VTDFAFRSSPGNRTRPTLRRFGALLVAATGCTVGGALETHSSFTVGARVLSRTTLNVESEPAGITISAESVRRGYVEPAEPTRIRVSNTDPAGYALVILPQSRWFASVTVFGAGGEVTMGSDGGTIFERKRVGATMPLELSYRFTLASEIAPGNYPWPLHLFVRPLESP
jgi:hypothetical protein